MAELLWGVPSFWIERFPLYYGRHLGFFKDRGVSLRIKYTWGGPELAALVDSGAVQIGEMGMPPFLKAFSEGLPAKVIASSTIQQLDHFLVGRPEIGTVADLKGKKIGILSFGSCDDYFLRTILNHANIDPENDVEIVPLADAYGDITCFSTGRIDAGFLIEPYVAQAEDIGVAKVLATVKNYFPSYQWGIILAHNTLIEQNPNLIRAALSAYRDACQAIQRDTERAAAFGAQVFQIKKRIFRQALCRGLGSWELDGRIDINGMRNSIRIQHENGAVSRKFEPDELLEQM